MTLGSQFLKLIAESQTLEVLQAVDNPHASGEDTTRPLSKHADDKRSFPADRTKEPWHTRKFFLERAQ